jgi:hypothetical protein
LTDSLVREAELHAEIVNANMHETALRESEERYRVVSDLTSDYAYKDVVLRNGGISPEWITDSFTRLTGLHPGGCARTRFRMNVISPRRCARLAPAFAKDPFGGCRYGGIPRTHQGRGLRWFKDFANPVWDQQAGRVGSFYGARAGCHRSKERRGALSHGDRIGAECHPHG